LTNDVGDQQAGRHIATELAAQGMRIITLNCNGIRSAASKGFKPWLARQKADVVCLQEVKAHWDDLPDELRSPKGWHAYYACAEKKGYSGVAIWTRKAPDEVVCGLGVPEIDRDGRYIEVRFGNLCVASVYVPSGASSEAALARKFHFMEHATPLIAKRRASGLEYVLCGDWNVAHQPIDLKNWRSNQKNSGFLPEERAWLTTLFDDAGWVDVFRRLDPRPEQYTWWSNRGQAWQNNVGWRIDYHIATPGIGRTATRAQIYLTKRFSDHAPLIIDYGHDLHQKTAA
jgi:exodeoxyribonuclease III